MERFQKIESERFFREAHRLLSTIFPRYREIVLDHNRCHRTTYYRMPKGSCLPDVATRDKIIVGLRKLINELTEFIETYQHIEE